MDVYIYIFDGTNLIDTRIASVPHKVLQDILSYIMGLVPVLIKQFQGTFQE